MDKLSYKPEILSEVSSLPTIERKPVSDKTSEDWNKAGSVGTLPQMTDCPPSHFTFVKDQPSTGYTPGGWQRPPTLPQSSRREQDRVEPEQTGRAAKKGIFKVFESRFLHGTHNTDAFGSQAKDSSPVTSPKSSNRHSTTETNAKKLLREAFKLCGLANYEPTKAQIDRFVSLNDLDGDGVVGTRDLEDRIELLQDEDQLAFSSRSNQGSGFSSGPNAALASPRNSEKELLKKAAKDKLGDSGFELLTNQCKRVFQEFDTHDLGYIEYENLLPLLGQVYSLFGLKQKPSPLDAKKYIEVIDSDKDGRISWSDFELFLMKVLGSIEKTLSSGSDGSRNARSGSQESKENQPPKRFSQGQYLNQEPVNRSIQEEKGATGTESRRSSFAEDHQPRSSQKHEYFGSRSNAGSFGARGSNHSLQATQDRLSVKPPSPAFSP